VIDGRKRVAGALATLCIAAMGGSMMTAAPSTAEPSIEDVRDRVERLYHEAEQASERYNDARVELKAAQARLKTLEADLDRQREKVETVRDVVASAVVSQYQGQAFSTATQVLLAEDPDEFLSQLTTISQYNNQQGQVVSDLTVQIDRLKAREAIAQRELDTIERSRDILAKEKAVIDEKAAEAESLLERLEDEAAAARASRSTPRVPVNIPASGRAQAAIQYAMSQVGDPYIWGAAGPNGFDCSGLTMAAWAQAGVALPHSSSAQMGYGTRVSSSALAPGDLVFYYSPVSHVGMYIGNGMIVHAANPSTGVRVAPVFSMPFSGAVRPG